MEKITIEKLFKSGIISVRTYNVCQHCRLNTLWDILEYFKKYSSFLTLRNCGKKVNEELINLSNNYESLVIKKIREPENFEENKNAAIQNYINSVMKNEIPVLTNAQKNIINFQILVWAKLLSKRAYNSLYYLLNGNFSIDNIYEIILSNIYFNFKKVRNVGTITLPELNKFMNNIRTYISIISIISNDRKDITDHDNNKIENITIRVYEAFLYNEFSLLSAHLDEIRTIYNRTGKVPIFKILDILINEGYLFNNEERTVFNHILSFRSDFSNSPGKVPEMTKFSKEKLNQLKIKMLKEFEDLFRFITIFDFSDLYSINLKDNFVTITKCDADRINKLENVNFSKKFYIRILSLFAKSTHNLIEFQGTSSNKIDHDNPDEAKGQYLIAMNMTSVFNYNEFIRDFYRLDINSREKEILNLNNFIKKYFYTQDFNDYGNILKICKEIIKNEFRYKKRRLLANLRAGTLVQ